MIPDKKMTAEGWERQVTYDDPRLSEMVEMYEKIGFEVHLEPLNAENESACTACMRLTPDLFKTIYTRRKAEQGMTIDE